MTDAEETKRNLEALQAAVPPVLDPDRWERHEGMRETTLAVFTEPRLNAALRTVWDLWYTMALEYRRYWPVEPEGSFRHQAWAGLADLRHLQGFLASLSGERKGSVLTPEEEGLSRLCGRLAARVRRIADALERELGTGRSGG
jgi:hypothetical protein